MNDQELVSNLLGRMESDDLDFKTDQYHLSNADGQSKFIKDILAMANTPRSGPAYIVIGVREESGRAIEVPGVAVHPDGAHLGSIASGKVSPSPRFSYRQILHEGVELGLIEISAEQPDVLVPRVDLGVLRKNAVYIRRNTSNVEADSDDLRRLFGTNSVANIAVVPSYAAAWEQVYRDCDEFDPRRVYIAVIDGSVAATERDWEQMAAVGWNLVVDLDPDTDTRGHYSFAETHFRNRRSLHLTALEDNFAFTSRSTVWIAAAGLNSRPTTSPSENWRDWNRSKVPQLEWVMGELARLTEPNPVSLVVFGGDPAWVATTCSIADRAFADRIGFVIATPDFETYANTAEQFNGAEISIPFRAVCEGLRSVRVDGSPSPQPAFPHLDGGTVALSQDRAPWVEEQLEPPRVVTDLRDELEPEDDAFLKGSRVSWRDLELGVDSERDLTSHIQLTVVRELEERATRRVNLWHRPGAGATTVARRVAWNIRGQFPTVIALEIQPQETAERLRHLFGITRLPILVVIDLPQISPEDVNRFYDELQRSHIPVVLLDVQRRFDNRPRSDALYLDAVLSNRESVLLADNLADRVPNVRSKLNALVHDPDRRKRSPFYFGLTAFGRDFMGLESFVDARMSSASEEVRQALIFLAFAYYYGQVPLSLQTFAPIFSINPSNIVMPSRVFPEQIREMLVEENHEVRPAHYLIAEEILYQGLGKVVGERRNWRIGLADLAVNFIDLLASLPQRGRGAINDILRATLIDRERSESPGGPWDDDFSRFLNDIPSEGGKQRALEHLTGSFPGEPHFWAHLGRFYSRVTHDHPLAHSAHETAIRLMGHDSRLHHMAGMGWRSELYDLLSSIRADFTPDAESKIFELVHRASDNFNTARDLDRRDEHNYISHVQMLQRVVGAVAVARGHQHDPITFLTTTGNGRYREMVDEAQNLLSDLELIKGGEFLSQIHVRVSADLDSLYGNRSNAIQRLTNLLDRNDAFRPPIRRAIIRNYLARNDGDWDSLRERELQRIVGLATENIREEPASDYNLRLWLRAVRTENALSIDRVAEQLAYKNLQNPSVDTKYYLYILKFMQMEAGDYTARGQVSQLINECSRAARDLSRPSSSFEWLGAAEGFRGLLHASTLGPWDDDEDFYRNRGGLKRVGGRIATIRHQGSGEIELKSGLRAFFAPSRGNVPGGYVGGQDIGREVEFFLGFSYDGLRAWVVGDPNR